MRTLPPLSDSCQLEHRVAEILTKQEIHGWYFNEQKALELESYLRREMEELTEVLRKKWTLIGGAMFTPKRDNSTHCLLYTSPSPRDVEESRMPSSA